MLDIIPNTTDNQTDNQAGLQSLGRAAAVAQSARDAAFAELKAATLAAIAAGMPEQRAAKLAGVDRMTVRRWQGKR